MLTLLIIFSGTCYAILGSLVTYAIGDLIIEEGSKLDSISVYVIGIMLWPILIILITFFIIIWALVSLIEYGFKRLKRIINKSFNSNKLDDIDI